MSPEDQRMAIAVATGWKFFGEEGMGWCETPSGMPWLERNIPDFLIDLNAMHEAEKILTEAKPNYYGSFKDYLTCLEYCVVRDRKIEIDEDEWNAVIAFATAAQRVEAFLKTLGKWVELPLQK